jgi:hypothetical protein
MVVAKQQRPARTSEKQERSSVAFGSDLEATRAEHEPASTRHLRVQISVFLKLSVT